MMDNSVWKDHITLLNQEQIQLLYKIVDNLECHRHFIWEREDHAKVSFGASFTPNLRYYTNGNIEIFSAVTGTNRWIFNEKDCDSELVEGIRTLIQKLHLLFHEVYTSKKLTLEEAIEITNSYFILENVKISK